MYKFKFDPPVQHRRSLHPPKNDHIALLNTLDKCTQILREDRLWLRTQIKGNNQEVISLFKQFSRATQLGQLQVKLRKYVQNVKNKIKQQQLSKFRETLNATQNQSHHPQKSITSTTFNKRASVHHHSKSHLKSSSSQQLNKTTNFRPNKSQEHLRSTTNFRHFQDLLKYKYQQQTIEERESENVTSARLGRQEEQSQPLQQLRYNNNQQHNIFFANKLELKSYQDYQNNQQNREWEFEKKAKKALYEYHPEIDSQRKKQTDENNHQQYVSRKHQELEQNEESIFDQHFNESEKTSNHESMNNSINQFKNVQFGQSNYQQRQSLPKHGFSLQQFDLKQSKFSSVQEPKLKTSQPEPSDQESLFTPQQLLLECRNFLKNRQSSVKKEYTSHHFEDFLKQQPICEVEIKKDESVRECLYSRDNHQEMSVQKIQQHDDEVEVEEEHQSEPEIGEKKQEESYCFPQIGTSEEQSLETTNKKFQTFNYPQFETFANSSLPKNPFQKIVEPQPEIKSMPKGKQSSLYLPADFSIEDFIQELMQITEMNPFITVQNLNKYITIQKNHLVFKKIFQPVLKQEINLQICLTKLAELLNQAFNEKHLVSYPHGDSVINGVYDLLDIDQKGHIIREDIDNFLCQIEEAQVQNYDEVSEELIRLFDGADFANEQRLTYWHFYLVKNSEQFEKVSQLLGEFEFEIQRDS